jgi:hypothetical protein
MAMPERRHTDELRAAEVRAAGVREGPAYQAYQVLLFGFTVAPIIAGVDKFFDFLVTWDQYLTPAIPRMLNMASHPIMMIIGAIEIVAGVIVALKPSVGGWIVALWLWGIIANLLTIPGYFDVALRDFGLSLGAIALARLARQFAPVGDMAADL